MSTSKTKCDWQKGIGRLDPKATINFSFSNGFSTYCDNVQLFKALGIYDEIERDVLKDFKKADIKYWGIPNGNEEHDYYNILERPKVTVISIPKTKDSDMGKTIRLKNEGDQPIKQTIEIMDSTSFYEATTIEIGTSLEFNESTTIGVASESSKVSTTFSLKHERQYKEEHSKKTTTEFTISTGEQLVKVKNPTQITKFKVRVTGKFCINCNPKFDGHYLWMPQLDKEYECNVIINDIGAIAWFVEKITSQAVGVTVKNVGFE